MGNKLTKVLLTVSAILLCTVCTAAAEHIESAYYNYDIDKVEISGHGFSAYVNNDEYVTVIIMQNGETKDTYLPGTAADANIVQQYQTELDSDGTFLIELPIENITDDATYTVYTMAGSLVKENSFVYEKDITSIYDTIMSATDETTFAWAIYNNSAKLNIDSTVYGSIKEANKLTAGKMAFSDKAAIEIEAAGDKEKGLLILREAILRASYVQALNEGLIDEVVTGYDFRAPEALKLLDLDETAYSLFVNDTTDTGRAKVLKNIQNKGYKTVEDFQKSFVYEATIAAIKYNKVNIDRSVVKTILTGNNTMNGFDLTNFNSVTDNTIADELITGSAWSYDDVQAVLDTEVSSTGKKDPTSSSGGVSSGGVGGYSQNYGLGQQTQTPSETTGIFTDLADVQWASEAIESLAAAGVVAGKSDGIFAPLDKVTRAEFLTMLVKALGRINEDATCDFVDVVEGEWYYETIATGTSLGYAAGYGNGLFGTYDLITRQDAAVMLYNAVTKNGSVLEAANDGIDFADKAEISDYAADSVDTLVKAGILSGADGSFMPKANTTRAEAAVMIWKVMTALGLEG